MNLTLIKNEDFCTELTNAYNAYIEKSIGAISFILNIICIFVFRKIVRVQNEEVYRYLLVKSIADTYTSLRTILKSVLNCQDCVVEHVYAMKIVYLVFFLYIDYSTEFLSILIQMAAIFNRYRFLTQRFKWFDKISYKIVILIVTMLSFLFHIYVLFDNRITSKTRNNTTDTIYSIKGGHLGQTGLILNYIQVTIRDIIFVVIILILNVLTLRWIKVVMKKKKCMQRVNISVNSRKILNKSEKAEHRLTLMVVATSINILTAYGISLFNVLAKTETISPNKCFISISYFHYWFSFSFYFFIYFYFNLSFKRYLLSMITCRIFINTK